MKKIENFLKTETSYSANEIITNQGKNIAWRSFVRQLSASSYEHTVLQFSKTIIKKLEELSPLDAKESKFLEFINKFTIAQCLRKSDFIELVESL
jgi:hypothetical protein